MKAIDYKPGFLKKLKNRRYASGLLKYCFDESRKDGDWASFGHLLKDVIAAHGGNEIILKRTGLSRYKLARMIGSDGSPRIFTLIPVLEEFGLELQIVPKKRKRKGGCHQG